MVNMRNDAEIPYSRRWNLQFQKQNKNEVAKQSKANTPNPIETKQKM